jgi:hypothetical protein
MVVGVEEVISNHSFACMRSDVMLCLRCVQILTGWPR